MVVEPSQGSSVWLSIRAMGVDDESQGIGKESLPQL